jgi:hypothetical protein
VRAWVGECVCACTHMHACVCKIHTYIYIIDVHQTFGNITTVSAGEYPYGNSLRSAVLQSVTQYNW